MANFTEIALIASIKGLTDFNSGTAMMRRQMGLTGRSASSFAKGFNTSIGSMGQSILNAGRTVRSFGNELTFLGFQLTFLATGAFVAVTQAGSKFESTLVRMSTLATASVSQLGALGQTALTLGRQVGIGPTELADAMFDIVSSGFDAAQAMEIIQSTSRGAAIGLGDVRTVTDAVTSAMRAFSDQNLTASRATDILVQAVREGKGEVDNLAPTIGRVLGIAGELGLTFEQTAAFIATFTRVGVPAEVAVTSLRSALTNILKPTAAADTALEKYGLTMDDIKAIIADPNRGLQDALIVLATIMEGDSEAFGDVIGSARGLAGVLINTGPLLQDYQQVLAAIGGSAGATTDAFDLFAQTTEFRVNAAKAAFESLFITVSNTLRPIINLILDEIPKITTAIEALVKANPKLALLAGGFAALVAAMGPLLIIVGLSITAFGTFINVIGAGITFFSGLIVPISLVVAALAAFVVFFNDTFVNVFQSVKNTVNAQGQAISNDAFGWGRNIIVQFARGMAAAVTYVFQVLTALGQAISNLLRPGSPPKLLPDLDKWGQGAMEAYMDGWLQADFNVFQEIAGTIESFLRSLSIDPANVVPTILGIRTEIARIIDIFRETGIVAEDAIQRIIASFGDAGPVIGQYIEAMLEVETATQAVTAAQGQLGEAQKALTAAQEALNDVQEKYNALLEPISDELEAIARRRQEVADDMRIDELQAIINDENAPALAKELALMELREIELRRQQQAIEDRQEADEEAAQANIDHAQEAVDAAEEALAMAQEELRLAEERVQALHQFIQVQQENNALIKEQISLLESLQDGIGGIGGALDELATGGGIDIPINPPDIGGILDEVGISEDLDELWRKLSGPGGPDDLGLGSLDSLFGDITEAAEDMVASFEGIGEDIKKEWQPAIDAFDTLETTWSGVFATLTTGISPDSAIGRVTEFIKQLTADQVTKVGDLATEFGRLFGNLQGIATGPIGQLVGDVASLLVSIITLGGILVGPVGEALGEDGPLSEFALNIDTAGEAVLEFLVPIQKFTKGLQFINETIELVRPGVEEFIRRLRIDFDNFLGWLDTNFGAGGPIPTALNNLGNWAGETGLKLQGFVNDVLGFFTDQLTPGIDEQAEKSTNRLRRFGRESGGIFTAFKDEAERIFQKFSDLIVAEGGIMPAFVSLLTGEGGLIPGLYDSLVGEEGLFPGIGMLGAAAFQAMSDAVKFILDGDDGLVPRVKGAFDTLRTWIAEQIGSFREAGRNIGQGLLDGITEMVQPLIDFIQGLLLQLQGVTEETNDSDSPSKVYMQFGRDMIDGLILGMTERAMAAMATMSGIMAQTQAQASSTMSGPIAGPSAAPISYISNSRESSIGPVNIYNGMDIAMLKAMIRQEINGSI